MSGRLSSQVRSIMHTIESQVHSVAHVLPYEMSNNETSAHVGWYTNTGTVGLTVTPEGITVTVYKEVEQTAADKAAGFVEDNYRYVSQHMTSYTARAVGWILLAMTEG